MTDKTAPHLVCLQTFEMYQGWYQGWSTHARANAVAISPDREKIAASGFRNSYTWAFTTWDFETEINMNFMPEHEPHRAESSSLTFSADGKTIVVATLDQTNHSSPYHPYPSLSCWSWSLWSPGSHTVQSPEGGWIFSVASHPVERQFATIDGYGRIRLWHDYDCTQNLHEIRHWDAHEGTAYVIVYSPDGNLLCSGGADKLIKLWDSQSGRLIRAYAGHDHGLRSIALSPDSATVVSGSDQRIKIWDTFSGELRHSFFGHCDWVRGLAITADGQFLISGGAAKIKIWDLETGRKLSSIEAHEGAIQSIALNKDLLVTGSIDGTVKLWQLQ
ncbi:WD40 repeat domain-containing protein [Pseudanabaenaceae cyanobacterium LEGE 13415]|nr:WD40 repeat domain-containing protein [Pseudanabaenaceae cyanobacterium LEGE 13415]